MSHEQNQPWPWRPNTTLCSDIEPPIATIIDLLTCRGWSDGNSEAARENADDDDFAQGFCGTELDITQYGIPAVIGNKDGVSVEPIG